MTWSRVLLLLLPLAGASCTTLPPPVVTERFNGDYAKLAACAYERASQDDMTNLRFSDLRAANTAMINKEVSGTPIWEAKFIKDGANSSRVEIRAFPTIWGPELHARNIQDHIRACATQG